MRINLKIRLILAVLSVLFSQNVYAGAEHKVSAFLRVKDEIKTIEATLNSIDGVFDKIVIIHSNEKDDGSVALMNAWCGKREYCEIHEYPHPVVPSHQYKGKVPFENQLASYNNFGLSFFEPEEWVVKIDADQVYLTDRLKEFVSFLKQNENNNKKFGLIGYNTFSFNGQFVKYRRVPINAVGGDSYVVQRKNINKFVSLGQFEDTQFQGITEKRVWDKPVWFHFMKSIKSGGIVRDKDKISENEVSFLTKEEADLFNTHIRPLLQNSPYYNLKLHPDIPQVAKKEPNSK